MEDIWISDSDANCLFSMLSRLPALEQINALQFVAEWIVGPRDRPIFEFDSDLNHALYLLGLAHEASGQRNEAARFFLTAIDVWPIDADSYVAFSNLSDDLNKQISILEQGLGLFDDPRVRLNLSHAYSESGNISLALQHLKAIPKTWPEYDRVIEDMRILNLRIT